jgi:hypothetical protein
MEYLTFDGKVEQFSSYLAEKGAAWKIYTEKSEYWKIG